MVGILAAIAMQTPALPEPPREFRGVWIATVDNIDWPSKRTLTTERQIVELCAILDKAKALNLNAVVFQIRPSADALYASSIEPWSEYLTGRQGEPPQPYWDPLSYVCAEGHKRGLEVHCWFNPYRAWHPAARSIKATDYVGAMLPGAVKVYGNYEWMDPGEKSVQDRTIQVMLDVVKRYDIDAVHIDDYFYPYPIKAGGQDVPFPDQESWAKYQASGGSLSRSDWRRQNVDTFIERAYREIHETKKWVKFGISPFGIYRPGVPAGIKAGVDQYADLYADCKKWLNEGWCDYMSPQLYWPIGQTAQSYPALLKWWMSENTAKRHLWVGNFTGRTDPSEGNWKAKEVTDQIDVTRKLGAGGNIHFSMKCLMRNSSGIADALSDGEYAQPALVPESPWLAQGKPKVPELVESLRDKDKARIEWKTADDARAYLVQGLVGESWQTWYTGSGSRIEISLRGISTNSRLVAVRMVDRVGQLSEPLYVDIGL